jgi:hypothetical protein
MKNLVCFKIHGLIDFHGQSYSLGMMVWLFKFATKFVTKLREKLSYWLQSLSLQKHVGHWKTTIHSLGVVVGNHYYCKDIAHCKNKKAFSKQSSKFVMTLM